MTRFLTRPKTRSPGFGVSSISPRMPASRRARTEAGTRSRTPRRSRTSIAVANVVHRVAGFGEPDPPERRRVAVLDDNEADTDAVAQDVLRGPRHRAARLAATKDHDAPVTRRNVEVAPDERGHIAGGEGSLPDRARVLARAHDESLRRRSPASRSTSTSRSECAGSVP